jgi:plastocyanin
MQLTNQNQNIDIVSPQPPQPRRKRISRWLTFTILLVVVGVASGLFIFRDRFSTTLAEPTATVEITGSSFSPQTIKIKKGESITWINKDTALHHVKASPLPNGSIPVGFDSTESLAEQDTYTATFDKPGTYKYYDELNPAALNGVVIVE